MPEPVGGMVLKEEPIEIIDDVNSEPPTTETIGSDDDPERIDSNEEPPKENQNRDLTCGRTGVQN